MNLMAACLFLLISAMLPAPAAGQPALAAETVPHLQVRGEAELQVPADQFRVLIGVVSRAETARTALEHNSAAMTKVEQVFRRLGLDEQEYRTAHFDIQPQWTRPSGSSRPLEITGFAVTNSFMIAATRLELAGPLIEAAVKAGANSIGDLVFDLADSRVHRAEAIRRATSQAGSEALILAAAAGVTLEEVIALHLDQASVSPQRQPLARMEVMLDQPPLAPGQVTIRAEVAVTYRIAPAREP